MKNFWADRFAAILKLSDLEIEGRIRVPGAVVQGDLRFEREVTLYVSDKATIGRVSGATAIIFAGESAPPE